MRFIEYPVLSFKQEIRSLVHDPSTNYILMFIVIKQSPNCPSWFSMLSIQNLLHVYPLERHAHNHSYMHDCAICMERGSFELL